MFVESLVESTENKYRGRSGKFALVTGVTYVAVLFAFAVVSVIWLNPALADGLNVTTMLPPPLPPVALPAVKNVVVRSEKITPVVNTFIPPTKVPDKIPDPSTVKPTQVVSMVSSGVPYGVPGLPATEVFTTETRNVEPPPPPPPAKPTPEPTLKPEPPKQIKVSGGVLVGTAISKVQPAYPPIAKAARASGAVMVQVLISEEGRVIEAVVITGHPLLREASLQAAKQWVFRPTKLTGVPVKVQGVLTFNFTLQ